MIMLTMLITMTRTMRMMMTILMAVTMAMTMTIKIMMVIVMKLIIFVYRWKERFFILTKDYFHCFKKDSSKLTEMGEFLFKASE